MMSKQVNNHIYTVKKATETVQKSSFIHNVADEINAGEVNVVEAVCLGAKASNKIHLLKGSVQ